MHKNDFMKIVHDASETHVRVTLNFDRPVNICLHGKWHKKKTFTLRFFQLFEGDKILGYGYKQRSNETKGYSINNIPYDSLVSVEYPDKIINHEKKKEMFKKWVLRNVSDGVWPELEREIDSILATYKDSEYVKTYTKSLGNEYELKLVQDLFDEKRSGTVVLSKRNNVFVETSQRESGFYAWLVVGERSCMLINPHVAILKRK